MLNKLGSMLKLKKAKIEAIFLSVCGSRVFSILQDLCQPGKASDKAITYEEQVKWLMGHFAPKPSMIAQRYKFYSTKRQVGQSVSAFVAELGHMMEFCESGGAIDDMIRDRLGCIIKTVTSRDRLTIAESRGSCREGRNRITATTKDRVTSAQVQSLVRTGEGRLFMF